MGQLLIECNTNIGTENQNKNFKHSYLKNHRKTSLTGMLTVLIEGFLRKKYESWEQTITVML